MEGTLMSRPQTIPVTCPKCQRDFQLKKWDSINVSINPEIKERILKHDFFHEACAHCGHSFQIIYPCLYHDTQQKLLIYLLPNEASAEKLAELNDIASSFDADYQIRIVKSEKQLVEKIQINDIELDDRAIELCKLLFQSYVTSQLEAAEIKEAYFDVLPEKKQFIFVTDEAKLLSVDFNESFFEKVTERPELKQYQAQTKQFETIDEAWAIELMHLR